MKESFPVIDVIGLQAIIFDFDGVLTDNRVWVDSQGGETGVRHRGDDCRGSKFG